MICFRPGEKASNEVVGKPAEVQVAGGEVAFAMKMVEESVALQEFWKQAVWGLVFGLTWNLKRS